MKTKKQEDKEICPLWLGGRCPYCDHEWELYGFTSHKEGMAANRACCRSHRDPTKEELEEGR